MSNLGNTGEGWKRLVGNRRVALALKNVERVSKDKPCTISSEANRLGHNLGIGVTGGTDRAVSIDVALAISLGGVQRAKVAKMVADPHDVCPYSHATRGNADVTLCVA